MTNVIKSLNSLLSADNTLKAKKAGLSEIYAPLNGYKSDTLKDAMEKAKKATTKKAFDVSIEVILAQLDKLLEVADKAIEHQREQETDTKELDDLALNIRQELASAQKSFLVVGKLLKQANETLKADGKKQSDFVAWSKDNCGILKAQAYKLMKVYETFGDESDFDGISMRVLYTLSSQNDEIVEKARELAKEGKLDTNALDALLDKPAPAPASTGTSGNSVPQGQTAKTANELKLEKRIADLERENAIMKDQDKLDEKDTNNQLAQYQKTIQELNNTIEALRRQLEEAESKKKQPINTVPFLPQFNSQNPCTVLGLEPEKADDANEVNKAFRALAKIYTAVSCREGSLAISNARQKLLK